MSKRQARTFGKLESKSKFESLFKGIATGGIA